MGRYRKVSDFESLPLKKQQGWAQEFIDQAEKRQSSKWKGRNHRLVVRYVWRELRAGRTFLTEDEVLRFVAGAVKRRKARPRNAI